MKAPESWEGPLLDSWLAGKGITNWQIREMSASGVFGDRGGFTVSFKLRDRSVVIPGRDRDELVVWAINMIRRETSK